MVSTFNINTNEQLDLSRLSNINAKINIEVFIFGSSNEFLKALICLAMKEQT